MVREMEVPDIPLPDTGDNSPQALDKISKRFQQHTAIEIGKGNRLQASEKVYASIGYALSSVGELRGWRHDSRFYKQLIARQVGNELAEAAADTRSMSREERDEYFEGKLAEWMSPYDRGVVMHNNFRQNELGLQAIKEAQGMAANFIRQLDEYKAKGYSDYTPRLLEDQERLLHLEGRWDEYKKLPQPEKKRYRDNLFPTRITKRWEFPSPDNDDNGGSAPPAVPPSPSSPMDGGNAAPVPESHSIDLSALPRREFPENMAAMESWQSCRQPSRRAPQPAMPTKVTPAKPPAAKGSGQNWSPGGKPRSRSERVPKIAKRKR